MLVIIVRIIKLSTIRDSEIYFFPEFSGIFRDGGSWERHGRDGSTSLVGQEY